MADGQDVSRDCEHFDIQDNEESYSSIKVRLINADNKYDGKFLPGCPLSIRIAPQMKWWPIIEMRMMQYHEHRGTDGLTIELIGTDAMEKMARKEAMGHQKGTKPIPAIKELAKDSEVDAEVDLEDDGKEAGKTDCPRTPRPAGSSNLDQTAKIANRSIKSPQLGGESKDGYAQGTDPKGESKSGTSKNQINASGVNPAGGNDNNRLGNAQNRAKSKVITASVYLVGAALRGQQTADFMNVGSFANGQWYVQDSHISGGKGKGLECTAKLMRGATKESKECGVACPVVMYADIYKKDKIYVGPRKGNSKSQGTFIYGQGDLVKSFNFNVDAIAGLRANKKATSKPIDPNDAKAPVKEKGSDKGTGASGGGVSSPQLGGESR
jgi:hypothetical protein